MKHSVHLQVCLALAILSLLSCADLSDISDPAQRSDIADWYNGSSSSMNMSSNESSSSVSVSSTSSGPSILYTTDWNTFQAPNILIDTRDGKTYRFTQIDTTFWMAQNLNHDTTDGSMCYGNEPLNCASVGRLYDWKTANVSCPANWTIPSNEQWNRLIDIAGGTAGSPANKLKASSEFWDQQQGGTDDFGFSAKAAGLCLESGSCSNKTTQSRWWSSYYTYTTNGTKATSYAMSALNQGVTNGATMAGSFSSVRCVYVPNGTDRNRVNGADLIVGSETYKTVVIGDLRWMAENLRTVPEQGHSWCYGQVDSLCQSFGRLYDWAAAMNIDSRYDTTAYDGSDRDHQGICPSGWRIPNDAEWSTLATVLGNDSTGFLLKYDTPLWVNRGFDKVGFAALPAGRLYGRNFEKVGQSSYWWSATHANDPNLASSRSIVDPYLDLDNTQKPAKTNGLSVRCVTDN